MGHNAFVERYDRPNYKLHVIIFLVITGISVFLSTQVERKRENTDIAALKAPVPIDSIAIEKEAAAQQIQPSIEPPIVAQNAAVIESAAELLPPEESAQEYTFEDSPDLDNIDKLLMEEGIQTVSATTTLEASVNTEASSVTTNEVVVEEPATQIAQAQDAKQTGEVLSLEQAFQKQNDRFLETLAKTAQVEPEESAEIKQIKEAISKDKPLASKNAESAPVTSAASVSEKQKSEQILAEAESKPTLPAAKQAEANQIVIKQDRIMQTAQTVSFTAKAQPASQRMTTANVSNASIRQSKTAERVVMTKGELDNVVNQFTNSYNAGDINRLMALFAENARTNDRQNKLGIKADYAELFNNTASRKLMINDINWQLGKGKAEGAAEFVVTVQAKNGVEKNSFRGHIKITAIKQSKGVYITHLLHELKQ
ncbi:hypothetical protein [Kaarinaea lacus]